MAKKLVPSGSGDSGPQLSFWVWFSVQLLEVWVSPSALGLADDWVQLLGVPHGSGPGYGRRLNSSLWTLVAAGLLGRGPRYCWYRY